MVSSGTFSRSDNRDKIQNLSSLLQEYFILPEERGLAPIRSGLSSLLDKELVTKWLKDPEDTEREETVLRNIRWLAASFGVLPGMHAYTPKEVADILTGKIQTFQIERLLHTLRQALMGMDLDAYAGAVLPFLAVEEVKNRYIFSVDDVCLFTMMLSVAWTRFDYLFLEEQSLLLSSYVYRGMIVGTPVEYILKQILDACPTAIEYVFQTFTYGKEIEENAELVPLRADALMQRAEESIVMRDIIRRYNGRVGEDILDGFKMEQFIQNLYEGQPGRDSLVRWLRMTLSLYAHLMRGVLVEQPGFEREREFERYDRELVDLLSWVFVENQWEKIVRYYRQSAPLVPLHVVLSHCMESFDVKTPGTVERFLKLTEYLKKERVLKPDQDVLEFHEQDKSFFWHEEIFDQLATAWDKAHPAPVEEEEIG